MRKAIKIALAVPAGRGVSWGRRSCVLTGGLGAVTRDRGTAGGPAGRGDPASGPAGRRIGAGPRPRRSLRSARADSRRGGIGTAARFTGPIADRGSIEQVREAYRDPGRRGIADRLAELETIPRDAADPSFRRLRAQASIAFLMMYEGRFAEAAEWTERAIAGESGRTARAAGQPRGDAGRDPPAAGRDGELPGLPRPVELHLPDRGRGRATSGRRARARRSATSRPTCDSGPTTWASAGC